MAQEQSIFSAFNSFHPDSSIWIYQTDRELRPEEITEIKEKVQNFASSFQVHGNSAKATADILFGRFIIFVVDSNTPASGCSIDSSVNFMKQVGQEYNIDFFNRMNIAYIDPLTGKIALMPLSKMKASLEEASLPTFTTIFNNTITKLSMLNGQWMIAVGDSWIYKTIK